MYKRTMKDRAVAMAWYLVPYTIVVIVDLVVLGRRHYHHLGDYSGTFSIGLGWLEGRPYIDFPWPLWGLGQVSALITMLTGLPTETLGTFNHAWIVLNTAAALLGAYLMARLLDETGVPPWTALGFGLIPFTMPIITTGWIHSNPYFALGVLLGPTSVVLVRRIVSEAQAPLKRYEWLALVTLGYIIANNFAAAAIAISGAFAFIAAWRVNHRVKRGQTEGVSTAEAWNDGIVAWGYVILVGVFATSLIGGLIYPWLRQQGTLMTVIVALALLAGSFSVVDGVHRRFSLPRPHTMRVVVGVLSGWLAGTNILALAYGYVARVATGTASAPKEFTAHALVPTVRWSDMFNGTYWYWFLALGYVLGISLVVMGVVSRDGRRAALLGAGVFALTVLYIASIVGGWDMSFPFGYNADTFGLSGRYLWTGIAAVVTAVFFLVSTWRRPVVWYSTMGVIAAIGLAALLQSVEAKRLLVQRVNETVEMTDAAINQHLLASPRHVVLIANAYFPERAMMLYAYHNSRRGIRSIRLRELEGGRIRYIGRYGGKLWVSPLAIMREEGLTADDIMVVAEAAEYPDYIEIVRGFPETDTYIARINPQAIPCVDAEPGQQ